MKPHYGYYNLVYMHLMISLCIILGILIAIFLNKPVGIVIISFGAYNLLGYWLSMYFSGQNEPYDFSDILKLKGDEYVLDIGCGLGKASIGVAKQLDKRGRVIGIDIWDKLNIINNSPSNAYKNARLEGVQDKIEFKTGNALAIPFPSDTFDVVIAALILNSFWSNEKKERFLSEAYRVVRYGGRFLLIEHLRNLEMIILCPILALWKFLPKDVCDKLLKKIGFFNLEYSKKETMGYFLAKKPSSGKASNNKADFV